MKSFVSHSFKVAMASLAVLGAVQAQADTLYNVTYSQSFSGLVFGNVTNATVQGTFSANDVSGAGFGTITTSEINLATLTFNLTGDLGTANFAGAQINSVVVDWQVGDTTLANPLSSVNIAAVPFAGVGVQWISGAVQGFASPMGALYVVNNQVSPVDGFFPAASTGAASFTAVAVPIPEPGTYLMMLAGIAGMAAVVRRRKV